MPRLILRVVIARRLKADAAISNRQYAKDCYGPKSLAITPIVSSLTEYYSLYRYSIVDYETEPLV